MSEPTDDYKSARVDAIENACIARDARLIETIVDGVRADGYREFADELTGKLLAAAMTHVAAEGLPQEVAR